ncbi:unnamed protein product, partial [Rotaria sp. Silwood1]
SVQPSVIISSSEIPDSPPYEPEIANEHLDEGINFRSYRYSTSEKGTNQSFCNNNGNQSDDEDEYDEVKGQQLIQRVIEEFLNRRSIKIHQQDKKL